MIPSHKKGPQGTADRTQKKRRVLTHHTDTQTPLNRIVLVAINARYSHCSLAARSLMANMRTMKPHLAEFEIKQSPEIIANTLAAKTPTILAMGVYIWNRVQIEQLVPLLRSRTPSTKIILGGPEISYDTNSALALQADCVICGEAEIALPKICADMLAGHNVTHIYHAPLPDLSQLQLPTIEYTDKDLENRNLYIETSRGCPCYCRFCLSSLTCGVRYYPLPAVFHCLDHLSQRGATRFRFVDRSFNLTGDRAVEILKYFLQKKIPNLFLHLEMVPEFLSPALRDVMIRFPPGALHIETGIQSLSPTVLKRINRPAHPAAALEGIHWLSQTAQATVHADLIAGLPGETLEMFMKGFEALLQAKPAEIQLGILKHLPGTDVDQETGMQFSPHPPYVVIQSDAMSAQELDQTCRFAAHWERVVNRNHFPETSTLLLQGPDIWQTFDRFSQALAQKHGRHGIGLVEIAHALYQFLQNQKSHDTETIRAALEQDYLANGRRTNLPAFLRPSQSEQTET